MISSQNDNQEIDFVLNISRSFKQKPLMKSYGMTQTRQTLSTAFMSTP